LEGKTILITGGAKRVGGEICKSLHEAGANLMIHYHTSAKEARALQDELQEKRPDSVALIQADLLNLSNLQNLISQTVKQFGRLDGLINNASSFFPTPVGEIDEDNWSDLIGTNLKAPLFLSQAAVSHLKKHNGCIINLTDIHAEWPMKGYVVYSIAKAGLNALTKSLARELGPEIRVNAVAPGTVIWSGPEAVDEISRQRLISHIPLKHIGEPRDIATAVLYLLRDAPYITGHILTVDGGRSVIL
jgi:pteridine reductase